MHSRTALAAATLLGAAAVPPVIADEADDLVSRMMDDYGIPGVAIAVVREGEVIKLAGYGLASVELGAPVTPDTVFSLASTTKSFGGIAIMMLVEEGRLSLDDPLVELLPDLPSSWSGVTVRHVLTHTAGLPDFVSEPDVMIGETVAESLALAKEEPVDFGPGDKWSYNQTGYLLVGMLVEQLTGMTFGEFVLERIAKPLGLDSARFGGAATLVPDRAPLYEIDDEGTLRPYLTWRYPASGIAAAAGLNLSARDFARFCAAFAGGGLLGPDSRQAMWEPVRLNDGRVPRFRMGTLGYGCGWAEYLYRGHVAYGHDGGGTNVFNYFPADDLSIVVLTNSLGGGNGRPPSYEVLEGLAHLYLPDLLTLREAIERFMALIGEGGDEAAAYRLAHELVAEFPDNPTALNVIAWSIAATGTLEHRDLELALSAAIAANEATDHKSPPVLDTLARVCFELGDLEHALEWQRKAAALASDDELGAGIRARLEEYESKTP